MTSQKSALKAIKASLDANDFGKAAGQASDLVREDGQNYTALLFLGFAYEKLENLDAAEQALRSAINLKPHDVQGYKGLITLFEKQGKLKLDQYHITVSQLAEIYAEHDDRDQCQSIIDKYELFAKKHGSQSQYRRALDLLLPGSNFYHILEGRIPQPSLTYQRILESSEAEENSWINAQIGERRTRLGAKVDQVTQQVKSEAITKFQVEEHYNNLIDWTRDDDIRHELEEKLFQRALENLLVLPSNLKPNQRDRILNMANGMAIIKHKFLPAWKVALEWVDAADLQEWDEDIFRQYVEYFPEDGLAKVLHAYLDHLDASSPKVKPRTEDDSEQPEVRLSEEEQLILMNEGLEDSPESSLAHRIVAFRYAQLEEYSSTVETARRAQILYENCQQNNATNLQDSIDGVNLTLANALIYFQSPRHHPEAKGIYEDILRRKPKLTPALLGLGLIFEEDQDYGEAVKFLDQAVSRDPDNLRINLELAWCRSLDQNLNAGLMELETILSDLEEQKSPDLAMKSEVLYRIAYCRWHSDTSATARKDKSGPYKFLIESIKANPNYAPAYTLLGIYFQDYGKSKQRARVALQKAFEISTSELEAARRLAEIFASNMEWDLVELIAQRVVDSGKARPAPGSKKKAFSWPYAALGVVHVNKQQFSQSVVSFQAALRIDSDDYHSWVGLGESYHNAGRFIAASRAFTKAESIDHGLLPSQTWFAKYMLANVQKEMGSFDEAIQGYEEVLLIKSDELGVLIALLQTISENSMSKAALGMYGEAAKLSKQAIEIASRISKQNWEAFNLWKAVGDACSLLSYIKTYASEIDMTAMTSLLQTGSNPESYQILFDTDKVSIHALISHPQEQPSDAVEDCLIAAILAHKRSIFITSKDILAQAVAWYNLGWSEYRAHISSDRQVIRSGKKHRRFLNAAIKCFKRAIELEAGNAEFWNALGIVTMTLNPKISQHSLIRSLHLNDQNARTWTNLGTLYLANNENELANEAFTRAQSADPEYSEAWLGQGLLATLYGNLKEANALFVHAFEISSSLSLSSKSLFAKSAFDHLLQSVSLSHDLIYILQPLLALRQHFTQQPSDVTMAHLLALIAERIRDFETSSEALEKISSILEGDFEKTESSELLARFAQAEADLARAQLGQHRYSEALANAETSLDLSSEDDLGPSFRNRRRKWRLSAHITAGLAHNHLKSTNESVKMLQAALEESENSPEIACILAQVLWARGGAKEKDVARSQLFNSVEAHPGHVQSNILLAVIGLLDGDDDILEAVEDDLKSLRSSEKVGVSDKVKIAKVLSSITSQRHHATTGSQNGAEIADAVSGIMLAPGQPQGWLELAQCTNDEYVNEVAVQNAARQIPPRGTLEAEDLAKVYIHTGLVNDRLYAKVLAPWLRGNVLES